MSQQYVAFSDDGAPLVAKSVRFTRWKNININSTFSDNGALTPPVLFYDVLTIDGFWLLPAMILLAFSSCVGTRPEPLAPVTPGLGLRYFYTLHSS